MSYYSYHDKEVTTKANNIFKKYLTVESYELVTINKESEFLNSILPFKDNYEFAKNLDEAYKEISSNEFSKEEIELLREKILIVGGMIQLPEIGDPEMDFLNGRALPGFTVQNGKLIFLETVELTEAIRILYIVNKDRFTVMIRTTHAYFDLVKKDGEWKIDFIEPYKPFSDEVMEMYHKYDENSESFVEGFISDTDMDTLVEFIEENRHIERSIWLMRDMYGVNKTWNEYVLPRVKGL